LVFSKVIFWDSGNFGNFFENKNPIFFHFAIEKRHKKPKKGHLLRFFFTLKNPYFFSFCRSKTPKK